ncbi:MAG: hypothetical protein ACOC29_04115, partial [Candidatus Sumerlaeota bacterium]
MFVIGMMTLFACLATANAQDEAYLWIEGENPASQNMHKHSWYNRVNREQLSGGNWISTYNGNRVGEVSYKVTVPRQDEYRFWLRANPTATSMSWKLDGGEWKKVDTSDAMGRINIAADGSLDHRHVAWMKVDDIQLSEGEHRIEFRFEGGNNNSGGIDCLLLTTDKIFLPRGTRKPAPLRDDAPAEGDYVWVEGENPITQNMHQHGWYNRVNSDQLSEGSWISTYHSDRVGEVSYDVTIPKQGEYRLWLRANPSGSRMLYRIDSGEWTEIDMSDAIDRINIAADGALDHRAIAWINVGDFQLAQGDHTISYRFDGGTNNSGGIDCFLLTLDHAYIPRGTSRPDERAGDADPGFFAWEPASWNPERKAPFDLRYLNEEKSGQNGFVRRDGDGFVLGDGAPVRFWTVQAGGLQSISQERQQWWAQRLAAYGVNLVRSGGQGFFQSWMKGDRQGFNQRLDNYHALVAAMKDAGVYLYINHLFWNTHHTLT